MQTGVGNGYWLESAILPGYALTGAVSGAVSLVPVNGGFGQVWVPEPVVIAPGYEPLWRTVSHEVRANPALPPAQIELVNSHSAALRISLVADRRSIKLREVRIEPNSRVLATFERDAGATVVETYELRGTKWTYGIANNSSRRFHHHQSMISASMKSFCNRSPSIAQAQVLIRLKM